MWIIRESRLEIRLACLRISDLPALTQFKVTLANARKKYQDFLTLWRDADRDIRILKQAKSEYVKLQ